jgi:hypothetical protein
MPDDDGKAESETPAQDVVLLGGPTEDGEGIQVLRAREERLEAGEVRPMKDGQPLVGGEVVKLVPRGERSRVCDVEVLAKVSPSAGAGGKTSHAGPAQVATEEYRTSWERIFGAAEKPAAGLLN